MEIDQNDFKQLLSLLQKLVENSDVVQPKTQEAVVEQQPKINKKTNKTKTTKQKSVTKNNKNTTEFHNKFLQMPESKLHTEDIEIDRKLNRFPPTHRGRKYHPVDVKCRVCGKAERINPALIESVDRYKCNKCCSIPG
jgi:hypothetical protein